MIKKKWKKLNLCSGFVLVLPIALTTVIEAKADTYIEINNCGNSHHQVQVYAYKDTGSDSDSHSHIEANSGESKTVYCSTSACDLKFQSGTTVKWKTQKNAPDMYVHVKKNRTMTVNEDPKLCD